MRTAIHIAALSKSCFCRRINRGAERIHEEETVSADRSDVFAEQCQYKCFLWFEDLQTQKRDPAQRHDQNADDHQYNCQSVEFLPCYSSNKKHDTGDIHSNRQQKNSHSVFRAFQSFLSHFLLSFRRRAAAFFGAGCGGVKPSFVCAVDY